MLGFSEFIQRRSVEDEEKKIEPRPWKPTKKEILDHWTQLREDNPIKMEPISKEHEGSTYDQDTLRLTGSREFIDSVLSNVKDLLAAEDDDTLLRVIYRETRDRVTGIPTGKYSCYIQIWAR